MTTTTTDCCLFCGVGHPGEPCRRLALLRSMAGLGVDDFLQACAEDRSLVNLIQSALMQYAASEHAETPSMAEAPRGCGRVLAFGGFRCGDENRYVGIVLCDGCRAGRGGVGSDPPREAP